MILTLALITIAAAQQPTSVTEHVRDSTRWFGTSVLAISDLDKDGAPDFLVGEGSLHAPELGRVWAVSSKSSRALWCALGEKKGDAFGTSIAVVPDVNSDGLQDVVVGASDSIVLLSGVDGHVLRRVVAPQAGVGFGSSVVAAGGRNERDETTVFVCAPGDHVGDTQRGTIQAVSLPSGTLLKSIQCAYARAHFGPNLHACPDLDGDGRADLMVTLYEGNRPVAVAILSGAELKPIRYVINDVDAPCFGESLSCCADLTGDHVPEIAIGIPEYREGLELGGRVRIVSGATGALVGVLEESASFSGFGSSIASIGDSDRDGLDDLAIGASEAGVWSGAVLVYSKLDQKPAFVLGQQPNLYHLGRALARLGDIDGDGFPEFLVGVNCYENSDEDGAVLIVGNRGRSVRVIHGSVLRKQIADDKK